MWVSYKCGIGCCHHGPIASFACGRSLVGSFRGLCSACICSYQPTLRLSEKPKVAEREKGNSGLVAQWPSKPDLCPILPTSLIHACTICCTASARQPRGSQENEVDRSLRLLRPTLYLPGSRVMSKFAAETPYKPQFACSGDCFNAISRVDDYLEIAGERPPSKNSAKGHLKQSLLNRGRNESGYG